jgi:hypothetical protein
MSQIVDFYRGTGKGPCGLTIRQVWEFNKDQLEGNHSYIQWLFPLNEISQFNKDAPVLTVVDINKLRRDELCDIHAKISLSMMLNFYGFTGSLLPTPDCAAVIERWVTGNNHNFLRWTRILKFLCLMGKQDIALGCLHALLDVWKTYPFSVGESVIYWCQAISKG